MFWQKLWREEYTPPASTYYFDTEDGVMVKKEKDVYTSVYRQQLGVEGCYWTDEGCRAKCTGAFCATVPDQCYSSGGFSYKCGINSPPCPPGYSCQYKSSVAVQGPHAYA